MHEAYVVFPPANITVRIECITSFDKNVILGTGQGHLLMYTVDINASDNRLKFSLLQYDKNFSKRPILQVEVIPEYNLLFSLSDTVISVNDISRHNFPLVHTASRTKGATIFALDVKRSKSLTGETALVVRMCVAIKRKLQFWYWKHDELLELRKDLDLSDVPRALLWAENMICVGYKTEYVMYDMSGDTPQKLDLFPTSSSRTIDPCIALIDGCFAVAKDEYLFAVDPKNKSLQEPSTSLAQFPANTEVTKFKALEWTHPLQVLVWDSPYAVALVNNVLEVRVLDQSGSDKETFIQTLTDVNKARLLTRARKGLLFAASDKQLWCIEMVDISKQTSILLQQKKFQLALQLTNISDESPDDKQEKVHEIQTLYAFHLFANKSFKESMREFSKLQTDPCDVIRLFPDLLPQDTSKQYGTTSAPNPTPNPFASNLPKLEDRDLENGLLALIDYLVEVRHTLKKELHGTNESKSFGKNLTPLLSIIDTTLLKCYLQTNDSFVAPLLRLNYCHFEESEKTLLKCEKYGELIILYQTKGNHKKALQLLQSQADDPTSCLSGHERTIQYLQHLGSEHKQLIFKFADWVLEKYPEDGLKIFADDIQEVEDLPRAEVLDYLLKNHKPLVIPYLEHIIHVWNESKPIFHNILIQQYHEQIDSMKLASLSSPSGADKRKKIILDDARSKLVEFLKKSSKYSPESVLKNFPYDDLFEERAIILGKLGKHEKVLAIYIQILGDVDKAATYCEEIYQKDKQNGTIYVTLIRTLLVPPTIPPYTNVPLHPRCLQPNVESVLQLLKEHATKFNPHSVLQILPDTIPILYLRQFLELALNHQLERKRQNQVLKGLLYAENLHTQEQRMHYESKSVLITEFTVCPVCKKKFTNQSAFVRYANGKIVHYSCQEKERE